MAPPKLTPIATEMILPNLSGIASHPEAHNNFLKLDASNDPITENLKVFGVITCHGLTIIPDGIGGIPNIAMVNASSDNAKIEIGATGNLSMEAEAGTQNEFTEDVHLLQGVNLKFIGADNTALFTYSHGLDLMDIDFTLRALNDKIQADTLQATNKILTGAMKFYETFSE